MYSPIHNYRFFNDKLASLFRNIEFSHVLIIVKSPSTTRAHSKDNGKSNQNHADFMYSLNFVEIDIS